MVYSAPHAGRKGAVLRVKKPDKFSHKFYSGKLVSRNLIVMTAFLLI